MGSGSGSVRDPERNYGRHHRVGETTEWIPVVGATLDKAPSHAKPMTSPIWPAGEPRDRLVDTGPHGLHTFNLGSIPASVTPPRTWRRAAWFTVFASASALVGLLAAMSVIVGPVHLDRIDALPSLPTAVPFPDSHAPVRRGVPDGVRRTANTTREQARSQAADPQAPAGEALDAAGRYPDPVAGSPAGGSADPGGGSVSTLPAGPGGSPSTGPGRPAPPVVIVTTTGPPVVDPTTLNHRTQAFFSEVTSNVNAAANLTDNTVRDDVRAVIERRYGDISLIQVKSIALDPTKGLTVSMLHVVNKNGTTSDETATLRFTLTSDPKIENPGG